MPVKLTNHTAAVLTSAKAIAEAMNALFDADNLAVDHLSDTYEDGEAWDGDTLDEVYNLARETNETLTLIIDEEGARLLTMDRVRQEIECAVKKVCGLEVAYERAA